MTKTKIDINEDRALEGKNELLMLASAAVIALLKTIPTEYLLNLQTEVDAELLTRASQ